MSRYEYDPRIGELPEEISIKYTLKTKDTIFAYYPVRMMVDLLAVAKEFPFEWHNSHSQFQSFIYLAQEFGVVDTEYEFSESGEGQPVSGPLAWDLGVMKSDGIIREVRRDDGGDMYVLDSKQLQLLDQVGGPLTVRKPEVVQALVELARENELTHFSEFVFLKKLFAVWIGEGRMSDNRAKANLLRSFGPKRDEKVDYRLSRMGRFESLENGLRSLQPQTDK